MYKVQCLKRTCSFITSLPCYSLFLFRKLLTGTASFLLLQLDSCFISMICANAKPLWNVTEFVITFSPASIQFPELQLDKFSKNVEFFKLNERILIREFQEKSKCFGSSYVSICSSSLSLSGKMLFLLIKQGWPLQRRNCCRRRLGTRLLEKKNFEEISVRMNDDLCFGVQYNQIDGKFASEKAELCCLFGNFVKLRIKKMLFREIIF